MKLPLSFLCAAVLAGACASNGSGQSDRVMQYRNNAGDPVASFAYTSDLQWRVLSDDALAVWVRLDEAKLLEFRQACPGLRSAREISISNSGKVVTAGLDSVRITSPLPDRNTCRISSIRPLNLQAIKDARRELREAQTVEREPGVSPEQP